MIKCQYFNVIRSNYYNVHNMKDLFETVTVDKIINFSKKKHSYINTYDYVYMMNN